MTTVRAKSSQTAANYNTPFVYYHNKNKPRPNNASSKLRVKLAYFQHLQLTQAVIFLPIIGSGTRVMPDRLFVGFVLQLRVRRKNNVGVQPFGRQKSS